MTSLSLLKDCQGLIEKGHESWMSYFNKWETVAKYEEDIPENYIDENFDTGVKPVGKKKKKQSTQTKKRKTMSLITYRKNQRNRNRKRIIKKKQVLSKRTELTNLGEFQENEDKITEIETNLKTFLKNFVTEKRSKVFKVLAFFSNQQALHFELNEETIICNNQKTSSGILNMSAGPSLVSPARSIYNEYINRSLNSSSRSSYNEYLSRSLNSPGRSSYNEYLNRSLNSLSHSPSVVESGRLKWSKSRALVDQYSRLELPHINNMNHSKAEHISRINLTSQSNFFSRSPTHESLELKPFEWDSSHKSPVSVSRKINKEYFIKRTFPKMNITLDRERLRNLCLHKRTNSVSLSMENSNFTTPERKPSERKCFSENVLQRKRRCPSKLFFDNEEDSESDDQTENPRPLIRCQNKEPKTQIITKVLDSDSDECETIFDRVGQS